MRLASQLLEIVGARDLAHLASLPRVIHLDAQLLYLLLQALLTRIYLADHALEDARQLPKRVRTLCHLVYAFRLVPAGLDRGRSGGQTCDLLQVLIIVD